MEVTITVGPKILKIGSYPDDLREGLEKALTYTVPGYFFTNAHKKYGWDGKKKLLYGRSRAPAGCYRRVQAFFRKRGIKTTTTFLGASLKKPKRFDLPGIGKLSGFQVNAIRRAYKHRFGVLEAAIRAGKTAIAAGILLNLDTKETPAVVLTSVKFAGKDIVRQTRDEIQKFLPDRKVGVLWEGQYTPGEILVSSYEAIKSAVFPSARVKASSTKARNKEISDFVRKTKVLVLDECHHVFTDKVLMLLDKFDNLSLRIGMSGTPKPDKTSRLAFEAALGPVISRVGYDRLIKEKRLAKPRVILYDLPEAWFQKYLSEYQDVYYRNIIGNYRRNQLIAYLAEKYMEGGNTVFVLLRSIDQGDTLQNLIPESVFIQGEVDQKVRKVYYDSLENGKLKCIVATIGKEGLNLPSLDIVINAEGGKGSVVTIQKMRSLTASVGKKYGYVIDFLDKGVFVGEHSQIRERKYKSLKGFKVITKSVPSAISKVLEERFSSDDSQGE